MLLINFNPDIINLCEVEGCDELKFFKRRIKFKYLWNLFMVKGSDTATGQKCWNDK